MNGHVLDRHGLDLRSFGGSGGQGGSGRLCAGLGWGLGAWRGACDAWFVSVDAVCSYFQIPPLHLLFHALSEQLMFRVSMFGVGRGEERRCAALPSWSHGPWRA